MGQWLRRKDGARAMAADLAGPHQKPIGADKNCVTRGFVAEMRRIGFTPHVAQNRSCPGSSPIDSHVGYSQSINARRGIDKLFGWI